MKRLKNIFPVLRFFGAGIAKYESKYFLVVLANILVTGLSPFVNILVPKLMIDELLGGRRAPALIKLVALLVLLNLAAALANQLIKYLRSKYETRLELKFRELLSEKCLSTDFANTENPAILSLREKASSAIGGFYSGGIGGLATSVTSLASGVITLVGTLYIIAGLSPFLLIVFAAVTVLNMLITAKNSKMANDHLKGLVDMNRRYDYFGYELSNFKYGKDIRIYGAAPLIDARMQSYTDEEWGGSEIQWTRKQNVLIAASTLLTALQQGIVYGYFGIRVVARLITVGEFQMLVTASLAFANGLRSVVDTLISFATSTDFLNDYREFLQIPDVTRSGTKTVAGGEHVIEFRDVSFKYPNAENYSLRNVSIIIAPGKKLSVVGQNGAGKTTFIKLLCRLYDPTEGEILLDGVDVREYDPDSYRKLLSVVFQDYKLLSFTLRENIAAASAADDARVLGAAEKAGFAERLSTLNGGLDTSVYKDFDANGVEFSGGESQKIAIARAVYKDAPFTVLDEPTAALDPMAEYEIYKRFDSLVGGAAAIYISHRLSSCRFCDSIAVFSGGRIVQYGSHDELVLDEAGEYSAMWSAQAKYYE
jgi:ABC-type multidrug transport system fused ATPase/permease subunit